MVAPLIGAAARMVAKKIAENPQKSLLGATGASLGTGTYLADATADKSYKEEEEKKKKDKESEKKKDSENVEKKAKGGSVSSASKRADGIATKGKTRGRMV
jgi:hypothetical protein